jgi:D-arabinose 1-dehydrogenase-like Zn-dependent alcohol dehydrogenase
VLEFAAKHNIKPLVEEFPMSAEGLKQAFAALDSGKIRYRAVLSTEVAGSGIKA